MSGYDIILSSDEYTVATEYQPEVNRSDRFQTEADLEREFIEILCGTKDRAGQGYSYVDIHTESDLISNLRKRLESLNDYVFSEKEWDRFFHQIIANDTDGIVEKTRRIQEDHIQVLIRDDGSSKNIYLLDKKNIHNNALQVINQFVADEGTYRNRYDVTILVNGLPLVHVELKRRGEDIVSAFNQISRYQNDSFWSGCGLYEYIQIFVISNGTDTKYYSNTTREGHIKEQAQNNSRKRKTSNSFEFTSFWADEKNNNIRDLVDFSKTFFSKHVLLNIITKYCVFTSENLLLVMRPYQIAATERILNRIEVAKNYNTMGKVEAGGYIWHTTGSGKTLTSFKTAQMASRLPYVDKVFFVVDRRDLDYQTMEEYDKFEKGAANGNTDTKVLTKQINDPTKRILVTTIQKLGVFIKKNKNHDIYNSHVVMIFDECHRSQFGELHMKIVKKFKRYNIFGFTGTPIFALNSVSGSNPNLRTTRDAFGDKLHTYTVVDAIRDNNVLPFNVQYIKTIRAADEIDDTQVPGIDTSKIMSDPERVSLVTKYILDNFETKTFANQSYKLKDKRVTGFNSMFAIQNIPLLKKYYLEFKKQMSETGKNLRIATIFSFNPNGEDQEGILDDESFDVDGLDVADRDFLEMAIADYNKMFNTNFTTRSTDGFENYYKDISDRMKKRELDLILVVNMFLTGFDATTLNTLWVDKFFKMHGLIQAFSRTNRILNKVKSYGNIVCFRNLRKHVDAALSLFGCPDGASDTVLLRTYDEYYHGYDHNGKHIPGYIDQVDRMLLTYPVGREILRNDDKREFVQLFSAILRLRNILVSFDEFQNDDALSPRDYQDYRSRYLEIYRELRKPKEKVSIKLDIVFEIELIKQDEIDIDYVLDKVDKYRLKNSRGKEILVDIDRAISSSTRLYPKRVLIMEFIRRMDPSADTTTFDDWKVFIEIEKTNQLDLIIGEFNLDRERTVYFIEDCLRMGHFKTSGVELDALLPPMSRFRDNRLKVKEQVIDSLGQYYERFYGL